jgi:hypothetical protein
MKVKVKGSSEIGIRSFCLPIFQDPFMGLQILQRHIGCFWGLTPPIQAASAFIQFRRDKPTPLHSIAASRLIRGQREAECVTPFGTGIHARA